MAEREKEVIITDGGGGGGGTIIAVVLLIAVVVVLFFVFGRGLLDNEPTKVDADIKVELPKTN